VETNKQCLTELIGYLAQRGYQLDAVTVFYGLDAAHVSLLDQFYQWYTQQYRSSCDNTGAIFRIERATGNVCADGSFNASGADVAEYILTSEPVEAGDVVELDPHNPTHYRKARGAYNSLVAGVISTRPGLVLGLKLRAGPIPFTPSLEKRGIFPLSLGEGQGERFASLLALLGRTPVKVTTENGPISPGDLLTSASKPGYAMRCEDIRRCEGAILGKALESLVEGEGIILVLLTR
jgi:hypothetical protein